MIQALSGNGVGAFTMRTVIIALASVLSLAGAAGVGVAPADAAEGESKRRTDAVTPVSSPAQLTVATYNICRKSICPKQGGSWAKRKKALLRTITAADADLLLLQEVDDFDGSNLEMARMLAPLGYAYANREERCQPVECSNPIFYKTDVFELAGAASSGFAGSVRMGEFSDPSLYSGKVKDRPLGYAFLRELVTGEPVAAVSMHLTDRFESRKSLFTQARNARLAQARGLPGWIDKKSGELGLLGAHVIVGGDVNSHPAKEKDGPQSIFAAAGYLHTENAAKTRNAKFGTINLTAESRKYQGFPPKIRKYYKEGPRIDVIMTRYFDRAVSWEVFVTLKRKLRFDPAYRGSDHNMVRAVLPWP